MCNLYGGSKHLIFYFLSSILLLTLPSLSVHLSARISQEPQSRLLQFSVHAAWSGGSALL